MPFIPHNRDIEFKEVEYEDFPETLEGMRAMRDRHPLEADA